MLFLAFPSLRAIFKYVPHPAVAALGYGLPCILVYLLIVYRGASFKPLAAILNWRFLSYGLVVLFAIAAYAIYPIADARKQFGKGSTGDDAIIEPARTLMHDAKLYNVILYDGVPISPGPGWILINSPFALLKIYWLLTPFYAALAVWVFRLLRGGRRETNLALLLLCSSLIFWELLVTGHDLIAIGFSFVIFVSLTHRLAQTSSGGYPFLLCVAAALGVFATSRIVFIGAPFLLAAFLWKFNRRKATILLAVSVSIAAALHGYFYAINDVYQPFHLFERGQSNVGGLLTLFGLAATAAAVWAVFRSLENTIESWTISFFICLAIPLATIALGELRSTGFQWALWEGANYLVPATPLLLFSVGLGICDNQGAKAAGSDKA